MVSDPSLRSVYYSPTRADDVYAMSDAEGVGLKIGEVLAYPETYVRRGGTEVSNRYEAT